MVNFVLLSLASSIETLILKGKEGSASPIENSILKVLSISPRENIFIVTQLGDKTRATKTMLPCLPKVKILLTKVYFKMKIFSDMIYVPIFRQSDFHLELSH